MAGGGADGANCDCRYILLFGADTDIQGDPQEPDMF